MNNYNLTLVSTIINENNFYGKIFRIEGYLKKIIEYKDATEEEKKIKEVNSGLYCVNNKELFQELLNIKNNNNSKEFYFTDIVEIFEKKYKIGCYFIKDSTILLGVNTQEELTKAKEIYKEKEQ